MLHYVFTAVINYIIGQNLFIFTVVAIWQWIKKLLRHLEVEIITKKYLVINIFKLEQTCQNNNNDDNGRKAWYLDQVSIYGQFNSCGLKEKFETCIQNIVRISNAVFLPNSICFKTFSSFLICYWPHLHLYFLDGLLVPSKNHGKTNMLPS